MTLSPRAAASWTLVLAILCLAGPDREVFAGTVTTFTFDLPHPGVMVPLPLTFTQQGVTLTASDSLGRMVDTSIFSSFFHNIQRRWAARRSVPTDPAPILSGGHAHPRLQRRAPLLLGRLRGFGRFQLRLDSHPRQSPTPSLFGDQVLVGSQTVTPTGGPAVYQGTIAFSLPPGLGTFDTVVLTPLADPIGGGPEFAIDNVAVATVPEPGSLLIAGTASLLGLGAWAWLCRTACERSRPPASAGCGA